jgi:hypothetical protein
VYRHLGHLRGQLSLSHELALAECRADILTHHGNRLMGKCFFTELDPGSVSSSIASLRLPGSPAAAALSILVTQKAASLMSAQMVRTPQVVGILIML